MGSAIYTSTNFGSTWTSNNLPFQNWQSVAASADGSEFVAVSSSGLLTTTNAGVTWSPQTNAPRIYTSSSPVAVSSNGTELVLGDNGSTYISTNSGGTWVQDTPAPGLSLRAICVSADGSKLAAVSQSGDESGGEGEIYFSQPSFTPILNFTLVSGQPMLSWVVPSTDFILQENSNLVTTNWSTVTNVPGLNLGNLNGSVILSPSNSSGFYRLATH
jgi:hypothetical protein